MIRRLCVIILLISIFVSGCEGGPKIPFLKKEEDPLVEHETKLKIYSLMPAEEFDAKIKRPLEEKYPKLVLLQVTIPYWWTPKNGYSEVADLVIHHDPFTYWYWNGLGPGYHYPMLDLREMMKKYNVSKTDFDPSIMSYIKSFGENSEIFALPMSRRLNALYYNKDIFDKLGVPYPSNGMTWDEVISLVQELTRDVDGVKYHGLEPVEIPVLMNQLGLHLVDPKDERVAIIDPEWKSVWDLWKRMHDLVQINRIFLGKPWEEIDETEVVEAIKEKEALRETSQNWWGAYHRDIGGVYQFTNHTPYFQHISFEKGWFREYNASKLQYITENNFAMTTGFDLETLALARKNGHKFDIVALPSFPQTKIQEPTNVLGDMIMINGTPKGNPPSTLLQEVAFRIAMELLSEEAQEARYYDGVYPSLKDPRFSNSFASNIVELTETNLNSYLYNDMPLAFPEQRSKNNQQAYTIISKRMMQYFTYLTDKENQEFDDTLADVAKEIARVIAKSLR